MSLSRKRKKELRRLQDQANKLWASQQVLVGEATSVAREAGRQLGHYSREQVVPQVQANYEKYAAPYVDKGVKYSQHVLNDRLV
ncbi:MAG: DNA helicase, partial [Microbacterium sp.]|nr:DNA helicase [Microbacterium sp.]